MVEILGKKIPNQLNELTVQQFEDITNIHANKEMDAIEKHLTVFELLGIKEDEFEDTSIEDFKNYVRLFNDIKGVKKMINTIELDGYQYTAYDTEFKLSVRDTKHIEKAMASRHKGYISEILAILFKREDLTKAEHYTDTHIKHKGKLIREQKAALAVPYLAEIGVKLSKELPKNAPAKVVE
jgi:hypothetical protein